jgi:sulfoxide reductase heme-binding subunit YedZ
MAIPFAARRHLQRRHDPPPRRRLHRFVYLAAAAAAIHFVMVVKAWPPKPLVYATLVGLLLLHRPAARIQKHESTLPTHRKRPMRA